MRSAAQENNALTRNFFPPASIRNPQHVLTAMGFWPCLSVRGFEVPSVTIVDISAESRSRISSEISAILAPNHSWSVILPRFSIRAASPEEIQFLEAPDIIVVGPMLIGESPSRISEIRRACPESGIVAILPIDQDTLQLVRDLRRFGANDAAPIEPGRPEEFARRLMFLASRPTKSRSAELVVVVGAKGGMGATTITAGLGDAISRSGRRTALLDLDFDSQDLSRFLMVRPLVSEELSVFLSGSRPTTDDAALKCLCQVWADQELFCCPPPIGDAFAIARPEPTRLYLNFLEFLSGHFEFLVVDLSHAVGELFHSLLRAADRVVLVGSGDPACAYAALSKSRQILGLLSAESELNLIENSPVKGSFPAIDQNEFLSALNSRNAVWAGRIHCSGLAAHWPASGGSFYSMSRASNRAVFDGLARRVLGEASQEDRYEAAPVHRNIDSSRLGLRKLLPFLYKPQHKLLALPEKAPSTDSPRIPLLTKPSFAST